MTTYNINFEGYWLEKNKGNMPHCVGVYVVYRSIYNATANIVDLKEIIYIGQAQDINERINTHDRLADFKDALGNDETLCYACAQIKKPDLDIVENALIIAQSPRLNAKKDTTLNFDNCQFVVSGQCELIKYKNFTVNLNN